MRSRFPHQIFQQGNLLVVPRTLSQFTTRVGSMQPSAAVSPLCLGLHLNLLHREAIPLCMAAVCTMYGVFILEPSPRRSHSLVRDWHQPKAVVCPCVANLCPYLLHRGAVFSHGEANFCTRFYPLCSKIILLPSPRRNLFPVCG